MTSIKNPGMRGSTEGLKPQTIDTSRPQFDSRHVLGKVHARLRQLFPLMPMYLFERTYHRQAELVNMLLPLRIQHAQDATLGICPSGDYCSHHKGGYPVGYPVAPTSSFRLEWSSSRQIKVLEPPAKRFPAIFECPVCFETKLFQRQNDWTQHFYADVSPVFCIVYPCHNTNHFVDKRNWLRHEGTSCQKKYWRCEACTTMGVNQEDFETHLVQEHSRSMDDNNFQRCGHNFDQRDKICLFCGLDGLEDLDAHLVGHMGDISIYVLRVVMQQQIIPQPIIDPIAQGEANRINSTFLSIQSHPPTLSQNKTAGTVPEKTVEIPPQQPFKSAQSTAVSPEESLRSHFMTEREQLDGWQVPFEGSSNQHLQSQGALYGGTNAPILLPESASYCYNDTSILPNNGDLSPQCDSDILHHFAPTSSSMGLNPAPNRETHTFPTSSSMSLSPAPNLEPHTFPTSSSLGLRPYMGNSSHIQDRDEDSVLSPSSIKSEIYMMTFL